MNCKYVDWCVFENLPFKTYEITSKNNNEGTEITTTMNKSNKKFICQAPIGSGKSSGSGYTTPCPTTDLY